MKRKVAGGADAPTAAEVRAAFDVIHRAADYAVRGRGYRAELGRATEAALVDALRLALDGLSQSEVIRVAEEVLSPAVQACVGNAYCYSGTMGSLGGDGRESAMEWADGLPPPLKRLEILLRGYAAQEAGAMPRAEAEAAEAAMVGLLQSPHERANAKAQGEAQATAEAEAAMKAAARGWRRRPAAPGAASAGKQEGRA